jgi:hypothetical protein
MDPPAHLVAYVCCCLDEVNIWDKMRYAHHSRSKLKTIVSSSCATEPYKAKGLMRG